LHALLTSLRAGAWPSLLRLLVALTVPYFNPTLFAGGAALAQKLLDVYLTLFQLILDGRLGHAAEAAAAAASKAAAAAKGRHRDRRPDGGRGGGGARRGGRGGRGGRGRGRGGPPGRGAVPAEQARTVHLPTR